VRSVWVRAEAALAYNNEKLIPAKTEKLEYNEIPPPFNLLHAVNVQNKFDIVTALNLKKVAARNPRLVGQFRYEILSWLGVAGGTITLFSNLGGPTTTMIERGSVAAAWGYLHHDVRLPDPDR
jgi:hypothetical protein